VESFLGVFVVSMAEGSTLLAPVPGRGTFVAGLSEARGYTPYLEPSPVGGGLIGLGPREAITATVEETNAPSLNDNLAELEKTQPDWAQRVQVLKELPHGWDGFGAAPVTKEAVKSCIQVLSAIVDLPHSSSIGSRLFIAPLPDGGLELDWDFQVENDLMILVPPEGEPVQFLQTLIDPSGEEREREGILDTDDNLANLFLAFRN